MDAQVNVKLFVFMIVLAVVLVAGLGLGAFFLGRITALQQVTVAQETLQSTMVISELTLAPEAEFTLPVAMTATPKAEAVEEIVITDAQATEMARQQAVDVNSEVPFEIQSVFFTPGQANLTGTVEYLGTSGDFTLVGTPYVENGRLRVKVNRATLAGSSLPGAIYAEIEQQLDAMFTQVFADYDVRAIIVEEGQIRMTVVRR